jgi:MoaA/NifB/PqqE/SkfB family radical SAM enzyme
VNITRSAGSNRATSPRKSLSAAAQRATIDQLLRLATSGNKTSILLGAQIVGRLAPAHRRTEVGWVIDQIRRETPALQIIRRIARDMHPNVRRAAIECLILNAMLRSSATRTAFTERTGVHTPLVLLISPTMRCNLRCEGCYAAGYSSAAEMSPELFQSIIDQANEIGISFFTILGGEPFLRRDLLEVGAANPDSFFQVFTNGTMLSDARIARLFELGNVAPVVSIEGDRETTDARRGDGVFDAIMDTMARLGRAGLAFGYSATVTRHNYRFLMSPGFFDDLIARGAIMGWNFLYMPVGRDPDMSLMLTAEERNEFREHVLALRKAKPLASVDFWGDSIFTGGCIAGKWYAHVNSEGWLEPCIFAHFATHNLNESTLEEALTSRFFREIQRRQPFNHNLLMPCMLIDNPRQSREIVELTGARPTHPGAESLLERLAPAIDDYAAEVERVYEPVWSCMAAGNNGG